MIGTARLELRVEELECVGVVLAGRPARRNAYAEQGPKCAGTREFGLEVRESRRDEVEPLGAKKEFVCRH